ncbi:PhnD/SsuA/transferrin family substrate-binding protein [Hyphomicrobiaceae bacterium 22]|uniref:PhnD/SsuA/transferrin family substrate-binding protein n=2 Tax=Prosthecodimorpha staleyi TaxID=2840188 RepID=A0A947DD67_9HYPH|nr:PhnD/SsuA/transferrin family substrate-binding protein [Prosthecodimorpha staleyi]
MVLGPVVQAAESIRFAVTDVDGLESIQREFGPFKAKFEELTGLKMQFFGVSGRTAAVEAMAADQVDFVLTGPAEYVVFAARTKAVPVVTWQRPDYFAHLVTVEDGPIKTVADLKGKKVSFHEIGSTSRHLAPADVLSQAGLAYGRDYEPVFVKVNVGLEALRRGDLAALGMNANDLKGAAKRLPDLKLKVLARSKELPDDVLIASSKVPAATVEKVRAVFIENGSAMMAAVLATEANQKYAGGVFKPGVTDKDFDSVRAMYRSVGIYAFDKFIGN